ncbi:MAG TPA: hypothetical protein VNZ03_01005 [Terriglobales bacterium]|jgi:hypothetical protein|nr:hypothetical protein [Terriglobales bacterium]
MSYIHRWTEPRDRGTRAEYRALRRELKNSRTLKARRLEIETRLDKIAAVKPESLSELPPPKPTTKDLLALCDRVDVAKRKGSLSEKSIPLAGTSAGLEAFLAKMVPNREAAIRRAQNAPDSERAAALLTEYPEHPLNKLAAELARYIWQEDKSSLKPDVEQMAIWKVQGWLEKRPYNRHDIRGSVETVAAAVDDAFRLLAEKDAAKPDWFVRRAEKLFDAEGLEPTRTPAAEPAIDLAPLSAPAPVHSPARTPDWPKQVDLILQIDAQHLGRLAAHSPEFDSGIRASLTRQLQEYGFADGTFLRNLYNAMRPLGLSAFPPRQGF